MGSPPLFSTLDPSADDTRSSRLDARDRRRRALLSRYHSGVENRHCGQVDGIGERRMQGIARLQMMQEFFGDRRASRRQGIARLDCVRGRRAFLAVDEES